VAVTVLGQDFAPAAFGFAATARGAGLRSSVYLGGSGKLGRQLKWASDSGARWCLIFGERERAGAVVTVRDMASGDQAEVPVDDLGGYLARAAAEAG
jgi:histidyl-tRNA synthetase